MLVTYKWVLENCPAMMPNEIKLLVEGKKIMAIKEYKNRTGRGLLESKMMSEHYQQALGQGEIVEKLTEWGYEPVVDSDNHTKRRMLYVKQQVWHPTNQGKSLWS